MRGLRALVNTIGTILITFLLIIVGIIIYATLGDMYLISFLLIILVTVLLVVIYKFGLFQRLVQGEFTRGLNAIRKALVIVLSSMFLVFIGGMIQMYLGYIYMVGYLVILSIIGLSIVFYEDS